MLHSIHWSVKQTGSILFIISFVLSLFISPATQGQTLIYTQDFTATFAPAGWSVVNAGSGNNWALYTGATYSYNGNYAMVYRYNASNPANTWAFTQGVAMTAGNTYRIEFRQRVYNTNFPEKLKVTIGTAQNVASQTTTLWENTNLRNTSYLNRVSTDYTPTTSGTYYFAFNCFSAANMYYLFIDNVRIYETSRNDDCSNATTLNVNSECNLTYSTLNNASVSAPASACSSNEDVWFKFVASSATHNIIVNSGADMDAVIELMSGTCPGSLTSLQCENSTGVGQTETLTYAGLTPGTTYYVRVFNYSATNPTFPGFSICITGDGSAVYYAGVAGLQGTYATHCMQNIDCGETSYYYDDGGPTNDYSIINPYPSGGFYRTFCPNSTGQCVRARIVDMEIANDGWDELRFLNGPTQGSTAFWGGWGTETSPITYVGTWSTTYTANNESGCLSIMFWSDDNTTADGWNIELTCVSCAIANPDTFNDCEHAIPTCSDTSFAGYANGPGIASTCNGCVIAENFSTWYFFETAAAGTLRFNIVTTDDYDFALYKSADCNNLGSPVRCSYAMGDGNTGLSIGYSDYSEDVTGDMWVAPLAVGAGETYILLVNSWTASNPPYDLNFTFLPGFSDCSTISLPVELVSFEGECKDYHSYLSWKTASETNCDYFEVMKSENNATWKTIGYVMAAGNSNELQEYSFIDPEENSGATYYRLKTVDFDGHTEYGSLLAVTCDVPEDLFNVVLSDNNDMGSEQVMFTGVEGKEYMLNVYSLNGQLVYSTSVISGNTLTTVDIPTANLSSGLYSLSIQSLKSNYNTKFFVHK